MIRGPALALEPTAPRHPVDSVPLLSAQYRKPVTGALCMRDFGPDLPMVVVLVDILLLITASAATSRCIINVGGESLLCSQL